MIVDHGIINRWVLLERNLRRNNKTVSGAWQMDETYIKIKWEWLYYYRAVDKFGHVFDYYFSPNRDDAAAKVFLNKALAQNDLPEKIVID